MRSELISIVKLETTVIPWPHSYFRKTLHFLVSWENIELKSSKYEFNDISHQNKQGFEGKKLCRTDLSVSTKCVPYYGLLGEFETKSLFSYLDFRVQFACYPPESFKIICLTCIWSKFFDTSFHFSQNPHQNSPRRDSHFYQI